MKKRIDWDRYVPLGISGENTRNNLLTALSAAFLWSTGFLLRYFDAKQDLFDRNGRWKGFLIEPFWELIGNAWLLVGVLILMMAVTAAGFYAYHYQGSHSIYTMKRLPDRWELWRRCLTMPLWTIILSVILMLALTGVYYLIYLKFTPAVCLP